MDAWPPPLLELLAEAHRVPRLAWQGLGAGSLAGLCRTLEWLLELLPAAASSADGAAAAAALRPELQAAQELLQEALLRARELLEVHAEPSAPKAEGLLFGALQKLVTRLDRLTTGECILVPLAWREPGGPEHSLHAALAVVRKVTHDKGTLLVVNPLGSGSEYHPRRLNGPPTRPHLGVLPVRVDSVTWSRLCSSAFWLFNLRPLIRQYHRDPHPGLLYEALLPFLTRQRRRTQLRTQLSSEACEADWRPVPAADGTLVHTVCHSLSLAGPATMDWLLLLLRWEALRRVAAHPPPHGGELRALMREACRSLARGASVLGRSRAAGGTEWQAQLLESMLAWTRQQLEEVLRPDRQVLPCAPERWQVTAADCALGGFERLAAAGGGDALAGEPERPEVVLPIPVLQVPAAIPDYRHAVLAVQRTLRVCALFANQRGHVAHADFHIVAVVQHLFTSVFPVPVPVHRGSGACFWRRLPMEHDTQTVLLREIGQLLRHFLAASLSLPRRAHLHAVRLLTLGAAVALLDALLRRAQSQEAGEFARIYGGCLRRDVSCSPFCLAAVPLAEETKDVLLSDHRSMQLRTRVLDYFASVAAGLPAGERASSRTVLGFAGMRPSPGDEELVHRLALLGGFVRGTGRPPRNVLGRYLSGQTPEFVAAFPGLPVLRDAAFLLRLLCVPLANVLPERVRLDGEPWKASDLELRWEFLLEEERFRVVGLQRHLFFDPADSPQKAPREATVSLNKLKSMVMAATGFGGPSQARRTPSLSSASALAGQPVTCEDDALHIPEVPTFGGLLLPSEGEQLLTYLTVPYLRVPLILHFFNERARLGALADPKLQLMLDAVLFEPGPYANPGAPELPCPTEVRPLPTIGPAADAALATPAGRLVHELVHSHRAILRELDGMFRLAMERDMPAYCPGAAAVLYVVRLWVRATALAQAVARHSGGSEPQPTRGFGSAARDVAEALEARAQNWSTRLHLEAVPTLERWCSRAMETGSTQVACALWLHLALVHRWSEDLSQYAVSTLLCAEAYINGNLHMGGPEDVLGFSDSEIFEMFHATRPRVYAWLKRQDAGASRVLEHVVTTVASSQTAQFVEEVATLGRRWRELVDTWDGAGRFAPSLPRETEAALAEEDFAQWLAASVDPAPVEVNLNLGQLQFRQHMVTPVPRQILSLPDFREVFPSINPEAAVMWALVEKAPRRERYRFAGLRYEFRLWTSDCAPDVTLPRDFRATMSPEEAWVAQAVCSLPELQSLWMAARWFVRAEPLAGDVARLVVHTGAQAGEHDWEALFGDAYTAGYLASSAQGPSTTKEVEVFRCPATPGGRSVVHVYETLKCGPWLARTQVYTSDGSWTYSAPLPPMEAVSPVSVSPASRRRSSSGPKPAWGSEANPLSRLPALEIAHEDFSGESVLVPRRFLAGAMPECLLETFEFWRAKPQRLIGKMQPAARRVASVPVALVVQCAEGGVAHVQRVTLDIAGRVEEAKQVDQLMHAETKGNLVKGSVLVDLLRAQRSSQAWEVARWALQLDDLSHVLAWTQGEVIGGVLQHVVAPPIDALEFPRLGLSFTSDEDCLWCDQHGGLRVASGPVHAPSLLEILRPFPRFVLLQDDAEDLFVLVSLADRPQQAADGYGVQLERGDADWLQAFRVDQRHQLLAVHASHEFLTATTLLAQLHLMLLRVMQGMYAEACAEAAGCMGASSPEEKFLWEELTETLKRDRSADAAVLRLKLMLQLHRRDQGPPDGWDLESDLLTWSRHGADCACGRLLAPAEDAALLELCKESNAWELRARREAHRQVLGLAAAGGHCTRRVPGANGAAAVVARSAGAAAELGPGVRSRLTLDDISDDGVFPPTEAALQVLQQEPPLPEDGGPQKTGAFAAAWLVRRLPLVLPRDFLVLYELLIGIRKLWLFASDDPAIVGELLLCLLPPDALEASPPLACLLRGLGHHPAAALRLPRFTEYGGGMEAFVSKLAKAAHDCAASLRPPPVAPDPDPTWAPATWAIDPACINKEAPEQLDVERGDEGALTNPRALPLLRTLRALGDRRLPSTVWDLDCVRLSLVSPPFAALDGALGEVVDLPAAAAPETLVEACEDLAQQLPGLPFRQLPMLLSQPLKALSSKVSWGPAMAVAAGGAAASLDVAALERCPVGQTSAGRKLLRRIRQGTGVPASMEEPRLLPFKSQSWADILADQQQVDDILKEVQRLSAELSKMLLEDRRHVLEAVRVAVSAVNGDFQSGGSSGSRSVPAGVAEAAHRLGALGGSEALLSFQDVLQLLMVRGGMDLVLPHVSPHVRGRVAGDVAATCALAMLLSTRGIIGRRCAARLARLEDVLSQAKSDPVKRRPNGRLRQFFRLRGDKPTSSQDKEAQAAAKDRAAAAAEAAEQAASDLIVEQAGVAGPEYDPRMLCFEFISRLSLRGKQVKMVRAMLAAVESGRPMVRQMLMGEGKTTVVTPLVVLLAATAERACVVCCPAAILEFTCQVLRQRLRAALARPVMVFNFARSAQVSEQLHKQLLLAQDTRAALCAGPTPLKSLMLRFLLAVHEIDLVQAQEGERSEVQKGQRVTLAALVSAALRGDAGNAAAKERLAKLRYEAQILGAAFEVFRGAVLLLDDIDLLMHPLRSELHWPLGEQHQLDYAAALGAQAEARLVEAARDSGASASAGASAPASFVADSPVGARWQVAFHLLDAFYSCQLTHGPAVTTFGAQAPAAAALLERLRAAVKRGLEEKHLQASPHLALLSADFYHEELRPVLADWMLLWLRRRHPFGVPDKQLLAYLTGARAADGALKGLNDQQLKALNLSRTWLIVLMPHVASRIHRVHYGLLSESSASWGQEPRARRNFAVPFVGKDAPSDTSQFSHPDVVIGVTWLSYRLGGLRPGDLERALRGLCKLQAAELDLPPRLRRAQRLYSAWVSAANAYVRGEIEEDVRGRGSQASDAALALQSAEHGGAQMTLVPPLEWLDIRDPTQVARVSSVLRASPFLMEFYLHTDVFPHLLRHADSKLSASGQDLGGETLCGSRLGFSGTPNDLLPRALGACVYAEGDDAKMLRTLSDSAVVEVSPVKEGWSARALLEQVAGERPPLNALVDVGALITGLSNMEVAQVLLESGLPYEFEGVVFCDHGGEPQLLRRGRPEPVKLAHCTLPPERRFVFYDQVHTTGIDIQHAPGARAALTLGKDSTFRDYAQGAYRMRGIGRGQRLKVLLTPEVSARVRAEVQETIPIDGASRNGLDAEDAQPATSSSAGRPPPSNEKGAKREVKLSLLDRVCAWLLSRQASGEHTQQHLLRKQAVEHEGRRCAYELLRARFCAPAGAPSSEPVAGAAQEAGVALDLFRERVDYSIDTSLYGFACPTGSSMQLSSERVRPFLDQEGAEAVRELCAARPDGDKSVEAGEQEQALFAEMEQEHEMELFAEQEQEKEQEEEEEMEEDRDEEAPEAAIVARWANLQRDEPSDPWPLALLAQPPPASDWPFYRASALELAAEGGGGRGDLRVDFPDGVWVSGNFHRPGRGRVPRRLRTPTMVLEWVPDIGALDADDGNQEPDAQTMARLHLAMEVLGTAERPDFAREDAAALLRALGVDVAPGEAELVVAAVRSAGAKPLSPGMVAEGLQRAHVLQLQPGRYYVLLTLAEAEVVRTALHARAAGAFLPDAPSCCIALRILRRDPPELRLLDASAGWRGSPFRWQEGAVAQCLHFLNAELQYSNAEIRALRHLLHGGSPWQAARPVEPERLRDFFLASYTVRRRPPAPPLVDFPVARLLADEAEHRRLQDEATLREAYVRILEAGLAPEAVFQMADQDGDGLAGPADFGPAKAPGLALPAELLVRLFGALGAAGGQGGVAAAVVVTAAAWAAAFDANMEAQTVGVGHVDLASLLEPPPPPARVPADVLHNITIDVVPHAAYSPVWNTEGTSSRSRASIWTPEQLVYGRLRVTALRLCVGDYANVGFADARGGESHGVRRRLILQVKDCRWSSSGSATSEEYLRAVADHYCPHPVRFRNVWNMRGAKPLAIWRPVPPNEGFVALGMVATTGPEPPLDRVRCVPKSFCKPVEAQAPVPLWDNRSCGGKAGSIWTVNSMQVLWVTAGHAAPHETFWELAADSVTFDRFGRPSVHRVHERPSGTGVTSPKTGSPSSKAHFSRQASRSG